MDDVDRRIGARSFARLLGDWRPPDGRGLAGALADRVRLLVLDGRLPLQTRVPAERELAGALGVSRTTVAAAYDALREAAVLRSRRGSGSWTQLPDDPITGTTQSPFSPHGDRSLFDLAHAALPAPSAELRRAAAGAVHDLDALLGGHGYDLLGLPALRTAVADRFTQRGLPTTPDQILVTAGAQSAIGLVLAAFTGPGDRVLVEHPTYPNALDAISARGARSVPVPMGTSADGTGSWDLDQFATAVRDVAPRLVYVIPDFQNPTGAVLGAAGRERLVDLTRRTGTPLLVDETLAELALDGPLPPPVATFGDSAQLLTIGSASKVFWGGLRTGWIRGSAATVRRLAALRASIDLGGPALEQLVVARLLPEVEAVTATRRAELVAARAHLLERVAELFPRWRPSHPTGGLSLWVDLDEPVSSRFAVAARRHDVLLAAGPRFGLDGAFERRLRLPYTLRPDRTDDALERLLLAWHGLDHLDTGASAEPVAVA
ncbi:PLP-dependent aminotransferase family protein [Pseudonocardia sp. KRD-184]|uniref:PLP-dependent aminotransferase family protein n=1 Tax=Pseudonocardia oceani TaxID=2792013 RepID=A0ABS6U7P1_9PSEU|nr:PLP-dependent aminotransferase family protein [Pseudonocardia oceani]MBW0091544.1 PLP-dependent aminotransferase family protein [Pseudonocardia oceani]MBW0098643.1 PLP-dependent aminotransferase family protein [Pseudonocardia oceani]MBW0111149.1 PLP-dependent aminotransferase family protein [Pseudonocardia oceani]MBW0124943.1 PLP-dependent aminotransferase family protein [Pseudonocardia oceani]MBW0128023.1 PLP-dependent aminotransferase family protein [Pseudonocardia oceani]